MAISTVTAWQPECDECNWNGEPTLIQEVAEARAARHFEAEHEKRRPCIGCDDPTPISVLERCDDYCADCWRECR